MNWLTENITADRVNMALLVIGYVYVALKFIAPQTTTKADDNVLAKIDDAKTWAMTWAPSFWAAVEAMARSGKLAKVDKPAQFLIDIRDAYRKEHGVDITDSAVTVAQHVAVGMSAADKLNTPSASIIPALDPTRAPVAR